MATKRYTSTETPIASFDTHEMSDDQPTCAAVKEILHSTILTLHERMDAINALEDLSPEEKRAAQRELLIHTLNNRRSIIKKNIANHVMSRMNGNVAHP